MSNQWISMLGQHLWQVTLVASAVALISLLVRYRAPRVMFALWLLVLIKCVVPPVLPSPLCLFRSPQSKLLSTAEIATSITEVSPIEKRVRLGDVERNTDVVDFARSPLKQGILANPSAMQSTSREPSDLPSSVPHPAAKSRALHVRELAQRRSALPVDRVRNSLQPVILRPETVALATWLMGCLLVWVSSLVRVRRFRHRIGASKVAVPDYIQARLDSLQKQIGVRGSVTLVISHSVSHPSVVGWLRPTMIIPLHLIPDEDEVDCLDPVLAHEFLHIKRGDLWLGAFQNFVVGLWWFHPVVWWASRQLSIQTELLCDEAVVRALRCKPATYARRLLAVLESASKVKQTITLPRPLAPGMAAFGVTRRRLEKIMMTKPTHKRSKTIASVLLTILLATLVLPGTVSGQADETPVAVEQTPVPAPSSDGEADRTATVVEADDAVEVKTYPMAEILAEIKNSFPPPIPMATAVGKHAVEASDAMQKEGVRDTILYHLELASLAKSGLNGPVEAPPKLIWVGDELHAFATPQQHERIAETLPELTDFEEPQITISFRFAEVPHEPISKIFYAIGMKWFAIPRGEQASKAVANAYDRAFQQHQEIQTTKWRATNTQVRQNETPLLVSFLDHAELKALIGMMQEQSELSVTQAPKVTLFNRQIAQIADSSDRPFVTSLVSVDQEVRPSISVSREGIRMLLSSKLIDRDIISTKLSWEKSTIDRVGLISLPTYRDVQDVQTPRYQSQAFSTEVITRNQESALFAWVSPGETEQTQINLVLASPEVIEYEGKFSKAAREWTLPSESHRAAIESGLVPLRRFPEIEAVTLDSEKESNQAKEWQKVNEPQAVPMPPAVRQSLELMGVTITAANLTAMKWEDDQTLRLEADPIKIHCDNLRGFPAENDEVTGPADLSAKHVSLFFDTGKMSLRFNDEVQINYLGAIAQCKSGEIELAVKPADQPKLVLTRGTLQDAVSVNIPDEMVFSGDRLDLTGTKVTVTGNARGKMLGEEYADREVTGAKFELDIMFPILMVERESNRTGIRLTREGVSPTPEPGEDQGVILVRYRLENDSEAVIEDLSVKLEFDGPFEFVSATSTGLVKGDATSSGPMEDDLSSRFITWKWGQLKPGEIRRLEVTGKGKQGLPVQIITIKSGDLELLRKSFVAAQ